MDALGIERAPLIQEQLKSTYEDLQSAPATLAMTLMKRLEGDPCGGEIS
jgi:hypothetical protein